MEITINGYVKIPVIIDPETVIKELLIKEIGIRNWVFERDNEYYLGHIIGAGTHGFEAEELISKEQYDYIKALMLILQRLQNKE